MHKTFVAQRILSMASDFALRLATKRINGAKSKNKNVIDLDLSSIVSLPNAIEPIQVDSRALFHETFRPYGLRDDWFLAGYGPAENVVCVCNLREYIILTKISQRKISRVLWLLAIATASIYLKTKCRKL